MTYTRESRRTLNNAMHFRSSEAKWEVGLTLIYDSNTKRHGTHKLFKNGSYRVTAVNEENIDLCDVADADVKFRVSFEQALEWFVYNHAATAHSAQGATWDAPVVIADVGHVCMTPEWVYVALSRNRNTKEVYILEGEIAPKPVDKRLIAQRIKDHNAVDVKAGRVVGDLTVDWVLSKFDEQHGLCSLCHCEMEMPRVGAVQPRGTLISIDRIQSKRGQGHTRGNCNLTCHACNVAKGAR